MNDRTEIPGATAGEDLSDLLRPELADLDRRNLVETELIDTAYLRYIHRARARKPGWLTDEFLRKSHKDMFGDIWRWAGKYRQVDLNIGVKWHSVPESIVQLCGDFLYWDSEASRMTAFEIAARLQNRLTAIHPFKNGNGRHARFITDIFFHSRKMRLPVWPQIQLLATGNEVRKQYIVAMKSADSGDFSPLSYFIEQCWRQK